MSSIEERLIADIAAVTRGVDMTEPDLRIARNKVDERIDIARQRGRRRTIAAAAAAAVVATIVGVAALQTLGGDSDSAPPANPPTIDPDADFLTGDLPTAELLHGVWRVDNGEVMVQFSEDGTVRFDQHGRLFSSPLATGTYEIDGDLINLSTTGTACTGEESGMRASLPEPGVLRFVGTPSSVGGCSALLQGRQVLEQILPTSRSMAGLVFSTNRGYEPLSERSSLYGVWLAEGGGYVLEIVRGGDYYVVDESGEPVDRGQWSLRGADLTLTSSALSVECGEGDQLVLGAVEQVRSFGTPGMRATVEQNACGGAWTPAAWILIPHLGS
jgi:hypothetical protein